MSIERPDEPEALNAPLTDEPNEDRVVMPARVGEDVDRDDFEQEEFDVELDMDRDEYTPTGEGPPEGSEGDEVIEDDSGPVAPDPVPDPDAPSTGGDDSARSNVGESDQ